MMETFDARPVFGPQALWLGVYDALSARLVGSAWEAGGLPSLSALWVSSLCVSASLRACPDASIVSSSEMIAAGRHAAMAAPALPVILDCDCGYGDVEVFRHVVEEICQTRIAGICFEDKVFPKRNSFYGKQEQHLEDLGVFVEKIRAAVQVRERSGRPDLAVVARTEALVAGQGVDVAIDRLTAFADAGADALMVQATGPLDELAAVSERWRERSAVPLVAAPTMYPDRSPEQFWASGFGVYIYANHLLRAAGYAAQEMLGSLADTGRAAADITGGMWSVPQLNELVGASMMQRGGPRRAFETAGRTAG